MFYYTQCLQLWKLRCLGLQKIDGIYGSIVVRQPPSQDPNSHLYDYDLTTHVVLLSDWLHEDAMERFPGRLAANTGQDPESLLINGKGQFTVSLNEFYFIVTIIIIISLLFWTWTFSPYDYRTRTQDSAPIRHGKRLPSHQVEDTDLEWSTL